MPKRKYDEDPEDLSVPLPIQNFLWRQTSPFIRPKFGKLHEASCMEQREACKSFEKVLVQNIQFGLSPSLTQAIKSISRWRLIQAAFPHVMHCCAALLYRRKDTCLDKLGTPETKLLYTLQWIILDATEECADAEAEQGIFHSPRHYLFPISSIQVFVYLFAPLGDFLKHSDFMTSFRLENGLKLWESLWEYKHPNVPCFTTHVMPKRTFLRGRREKQNAAKFGDVFIGGAALSKRLSKDQCTMSVDSSDTVPTVNSPASTGSENVKEESESNKSSSKEDSKKDTLFCEICTSLAVIQKDSNLLKCNCGNISIQETPASKVAETVGKPESATVGEKTSKADVALATYLDVAVLRCLFISQWLEEGIFWALKYLYQRLKDIKEASSEISCVRKRSYSLPIPEIEVSLYQSPEQIKKEYSSGMEGIFTVDTSYQPPSHHTSMHELHQSSLDGQSEKQRSKKMKIGDWKSFVEEKFRIHEKLADRTGKDQCSSLSEGQGMAIISEPYSGSDLKTCLSSDHLEMQRPKSALAMLDHKHSESEDGDTTELIKAEMVRGRSMPSLHHYGEHKIDSSASHVTQQPISLGVKKVPAYHTFSVPNPIITVTEHSPVASVQFFLNQDSGNGQRDDSSPPNTPNPSNQHFAITRSQTDSNIMYDIESSSEATGSTYYITPDGEICMEVVLKAVHSATLGDSSLSLRVCEIALNMLDLLLSFGIISKPVEKEQEQLDKSEEALISTPGTDNSTLNQPVEKPKSVPEKKKEELTLHNLFMDSLWRICKFLGCPLSCGELPRSRPTAEALRLQILNSFNHLYEVDKQQFRSFLREIVNQRPLLEVMDFFHSFVGFCMESGSPVSPIAQKRASTSGSQENNFRHSYANNFGAGFGKGGHRDAENLVISSSFKSVVSRLVLARKDLKSQENMSLYRNIRQFMAYVREYHGGVFRRVALSGLLDSAERPYKKNKNTIPTTRIVRHTKSVDHEDYRDPIYSPTVFVVDETALTKSSRKSFFRKRGVRKVPSAQNILDDKDDLSSCPSPAPGQVAPPFLRTDKTVTPRLSVSDDENLSLQPTPKHKGNRFQIVNWLKGDKMKQSDFSFGEDDNNFPSALLEGYSLPEKLSRGSSVISRAPKYSHKSSSHVSMTLSKARKRMEDHLTKIGFGRNKSKHGSFEEPLDISRRNSCDFDHGLKEGEFLVAKESKLVNIIAVKEGMMRLSFQMEACLPGSIPDPPLLAAALDLKAPVVARAALYLECAHFVHRCNKGCWPNWMRNNLPIVRSSNPHSNRITHADLRRTDAFQKASGKMFYQWAEAIGYRLEELLEKEEKEQGISSSDENKKRQLRIEDEEEDFLDEACVNPGGSDCPFALQISACQLLLEITAFMRETYQYLPHKGSRLMSIKDKPMFEPRSTANRRWSMALSSVGSLSDPPGERRISFFLQENERPFDIDGESENSSNTTLTIQEEEEKKGRRLGRPRLLRRGLGSSAGNSSSFKRRSLKLKKPSERRNRARSSTFAEDEEDIAAMLQRSDSIRSKRKVSAVSDRSDTSDKVDLSGEESPGVLSDDLAPESPPEVTESDDGMLTKNFPWLKVMVKILKNLNYECSHQYFCPTNCYRRQMRSCNRLVNAVRKVYGDSFGMMLDAEKQEEDKSELKKEKKIKKIITAPSSPLRRKASVAHIDKLERPSDVPHLAAFRSLHSSTTFLAHDIESGVHIKDTEGKTTQPPGSKKDKEKFKDELPVLKYIKSQVKSLFHCSISTVIKGAVVMPEELFNEILSVSWGLLLEWDYQLTASAAVAFILASVKAPEFATQLLSQELKHDDPARRINAILKFQVLWKNRYQCWPRMEDGAHITFKVPPPNIEFTLPSPKIASDHVPVADTPWMPHVKAKVEEVTINQDQTLQRSFVTATKTRRKQQMELVHRALQEEEEKKRIERENYNITTASVTSQAAHEPALFHSVEDHEEGDQDISVERVVTHHMQTAQALFPSCLCSAAIPIINLLEDAQVNNDGISVYEAALKVTYLCLTEDTALFLRHILEKLTRERQNEMFQILRKLLRYIPQLPPQSACALFNYLIGYVMFYVRAPIEGGQDHIGNALSVLWQVAPSVNGLFLKDLKQVLRKEQCDATLLITANVPSAKKIIIHGPDASGIPSQYPIHEDTQFSLILQDSLDFFGIEETQHNAYFLVDTKTNMMHCPESYVRDFYFFKRSQYPQLSLIHMNPDIAFETMQSQSFKLRFLELGKVLMSLAISNSNTQISQRVFFLHEELMKLPSFPRKALESDFNLYSGSLGKEMLAMDTLHKMVWVKLVSRMFEAMAGLFVHSSDIHLFLNVVNGALVLHPEDAMILRLCMSTFLNAALQFKNIFASNGYLLIMPTILRIYSNHQTNNLLCRTLEFVCKQFYILHRKPFILQMFGAAAPILDMDVQSSYGDASKVQPKAFFQLLQSLEQYVVDPLDILELVNVEKPLRALDFCYQNDPDTLSILDAISLCITVVAYAADSHRGHQMLTILEAVLPFYLRHLQNLTTKKETPGGSRSELSMIHNISICMKTLISNCEALARNYTGPQRTTDLRGSSIKNMSRGACSPPYEVDDDSHSKFMTDSYYSSRKPQQQQYDRQIGDSDIMKTEFRRPRDILLSVVSEFHTICSARLADLTKKLRDLSSKSTELLDNKCHFRLAEVAHSLLKVAPYDPITMSCRGLQRYMNEVLPHSEWAQEAMRPALIMVLRRIEKTFSKIAKKPTIRRLTDWNAARSLLKGVYLTLYRHPYIVHLPHLKSLVSGCQSIILGDQSSFAESSTNLPSTASIMGQSPPPGFCSVVVRLIAMQMIALGETQSLESVCGGSSAYSSPEKIEMYLMNLILPLCIRISSSIKDVPKLRHTDIAFALTMILHALAPISPQSSSTAKGASDSSTQGKSPNRTKMFLFHIGFLGLKVLMVCFEKQLSNDWYRIACCIRELGNRMQGGMGLWNFIDFTVTHRTPLYILLYPMIKCRMLNTICDNEQEYSFQQRIKGKLLGHNLPTPKSHGALYIDLVSELKTLKEDLISWKIGGASTDSSLPPTEPEAEASTFTNIGKHIHKGLSIRFSSRGGSRQVLRQLLRRSSYPYPEDEASTAEEGLSKRNPAVSEPRLWRKSTFHIKRDGNKKAGVGSGSSLTSLGTTRQVEEQESLHDSPGDPSDSVSQPPSCPTSPVGGVQSPDPDSDTHLPRHRLQRQKAPSRKTFRYRKSHRGAGWAAHTEEESGGESIAMIPTKPTAQLPLAEEDNPHAVPEVAFIQKQSRQKIASLMAGEESPVERRAKRHHGKKRFRSHSQSPTSPLSPGDAHTLGDSVESLGSGEKCTLLQEGESQLEESEVSLLMVSPSKDIDNTCV
ncbi:protein unc-80 homolog isoform X2 [Argiope bruennichi]|uniref:protein unc-80 homolog isoform X2 n=1 Tax=Argiope bruennichi TaxID=94029 RepID=UPI002494C675|nr:protein unc-80 homolog isoform X2 [Argiope bruennichi]